MSEIPSIPACYRHPDRETRLGCSSCGRAVCIDCVQRASVGQLCPECVAERGDQRVVRRNELGASRSARAPATMAILVICVGVFALGLLSPTFQQQAFSFGAQANFLVAEGQWYRLLTAAFLHAPTNFAHILFNMWALYVLGPQLEREVGTSAFAGLYLGSALAGGAAYFLLGHPTVPAVGASGAIFGLFGAWLAAAYRNRHTAWGRAGFRQLLVLLGINLALPFFFRGIAWQAHVGGLIAGTLIVAAWGLPVFRRHKGLRALVGVVVAVVSLSLVVT